VADVNEHYSLYFVQDVVKETVYGSAGQVGERQNGSFLVAHYAQLVLGLNSKVLYDIANLESIFVQIVLVVQNQRPQPFQHEHLWREAGITTHLQLSKQLGVGHHRV